MCCVLLSLGLIVIALLSIIKIYSKLTIGICKSSKHLVGKVVVITGGNAGLGYETAKDLADRGARVIIGCRSEARGTAARDKIIAETGNKDVHYQPLDLASLNSVRAFANNIIATEKKLDILMNNAGIADSDKVTTEDGLNLLMQINHFGPFLLTSLLLPLLKSSAPSRIVNVSSSAHRSGTIDFENLNMEKETIETFSTWNVYCNSKLCNILMTAELARKLQGTGVTTNSLHPGGVETEIVNNAKSNLLKFFRFFIKIFGKTGWEGAQTQIYLAVSPEVSQVSGKYFSDCREETPRGQARDIETARKLWEVSERLVKLK